MSFTRLQLTPTLRVEIRDSIRVTTTDPEHLDLTEALWAAVAGQWLIPAAWQTADNYTRAWRGLVKFAGALGCSVFGDLSDDVIRRWMTAPSKTGKAPAVSSQSFRRTAVRRLFWMLRQIGVDCSDGTLDIELEQRTYPTLRPLTDAEVTRAQAVAMSGRRRGTQSPVVLALAKSGATTFEIPRVRVQDVHGDGTVSLPGARQAVPRTVQLDAWDRARLSEFLNGSGRNLGPTDWLVYRGTKQPHDNQGASQVLWKILRDAGITDPEVRAMSIRAWCGQRVFAKTGHIEQVAKTLGLRSLDEAAWLIGWKWHEAGEVPPA